MVGGRKKCKLENEECLPNYLKILATDNELQVTLVNEMCDPFDEKIVVSLFLWVT